MRSRPCSTERWESFSATSRETARRVRLPRPWLLYLGLLAALVLSLSLIVSYIKARAESLGFACNVGIAERPERVIVLGIALLLGHAEAGLWVLVAGTAITVVQRILVVWQQSNPGPDIGR